MENKNITLIALAMLVIGLIVGYLVKANVAIKNQGAAATDSLTADSTLGDARVAYFTEDITPEAKEFAARVETFFNSQKTFDEKAYQTFLEGNGSKMVSQKVLDAEKALDAAIVTDLGHDPNDPIYLENGGALWRCHQEVRIGATLSVSNFYHPSNISGRTSGDGWRIDTFCRRVSRAGAFD